MPLLMLFCLWGVATTPFGQVFFILVGCVEGILITAVGTYINRLIPSAQRATILSFQSMAFSLFMIVVFPAVGAIGDTWSIPTAFVAMAVAASLLCIPYLLVVKPYSRM
jgi:MFS family permease